MDDVDTTQRRLLSAERPIKQQIQHMLRSSYALEERLERTGDLRRGTVVPPMREKVVCRSNSLRHS